MRSSWQKFVNKEFWLVALPTIILFLTYLSINFDSILLYCTETGDLAANALQVERARSFHEFLGPYSRFGFYHPGPLLFYIYAIGSWLGGLVSLSGYSAHNLTQLLLNCIFLCASSFVIFKESKSLLLLPLLLFSFLFALHHIGPNVLQFTWGPAAVICPILYILVSATAIYLGMRTSLFLHLFALSLALQTHIGTASVLIPIEAIVMLGLIRSIQKKKLQLSKAQLLYLFLFLLILNIFPVIEALANGAESNFAHIYKFFSSRQPKHDFLSAVNFTSQFFLIPFSSKISLQSWLVPLFFLITFVLHKRAPFYKTLTGITLAAYLLSIFGASRIIGRYHDYVLWMQISVVTLLYFSLLVGVSGFLRDYNSIKARFVTPFFVALSIGLAAVIIGYFSFPASPLCNSDASKIFHWVHQQTNSKIAIKIEHKARWDLATGLALYMARKDFEFCVNKEWGVLFGTSNICPRKIGSCYQPIIFKSPKSHEVNSYKNFTRIENQVITLDN